MRRALVLVLLVAGCAPMRHLTRFHDPLSGAEHEQLAASYEAKGEMAAAEREYSAATKSDGKSLAAQIGLGNAAFAQGDNKVAELAFLRALRISRGRSAAANNNLAMLYATQGRKLPTAEKLAKRATDDARFRPYALDTLATIYLKTKRPDDARAALDEARSLAPADDADFLPNLDRTEQALRAVR